MLGETGGEWWEIPPDQTIALPFTDGRVSLANCVVRSSVAFRSKEKRISRGHFFIVMMQGLERGGGKGIDFLTKVTVSYLSHSSGRDIT